MAVSINVNGLTQCHKGSGGVVRATLPDLCKTPPAKNAPLPYPNIAFSSDLAKGTTTVFADGGMSCANRGSEFSKSIGDEPGSGGGVKSGTHLDRATWLSWSNDVFLEGKPAYFSRGPCNCLERSAGCCQGRPAYRRAPRRQNFRLYRGRRHH